MALKKALVDHVNKYDIQYLFQGSTLSLDFGHFQEKLEN